MTQRRTIDEPKTKVIAPPSLHTPEPEQSQN